MTRTLVHSFDPPAASPVAGPTVDLEAANDASFLAERNNPAAGTVGPGELIRAHRIGDAGAHGLRLGVDRCANEITLDPDEDWPQVEASKRLLVDGRNVSAGGGPARVTIPPTSPPMELAFSSSPTGAASRSVRARLRSSWSLRANG